MVFKYLPSMIQSFAILSFLQLYTTSVLAADVRYQSGMAEENSQQGIWLWQSSDGASCRDGSPAGFFVQNNASSNNLLIYLAGGGACFNDITCSNNPASASNSLPQNIGILDSIDQRNPVNSWNKIYVPYCTGDGMTGDIENVWVSARFSNENFVGFRNMGLFLDQITNLFAGVDKVLLAGESAGGIGAIYNYDQTQQAFGNSPVYLLNDSGLILSDDYLAPCLQQHWRLLWNMDATLPWDCAACRSSDGGGLINYLAYLADEYPTRNFGFLSSSGDTIMRYFYGFGSNNCQAAFPFMSKGLFSNGILDVRYRFMNDRFVSFFTAGEDHTFLTNQGFYQTSSEGVRVYEWIRQFLEDQAISVGF